jgi:hypothetical protein
MSEISKQKTSGLPGRQGCAALGFVRSFSGLLPCRASSVGIKRWTSGGFINLKFPPNLETHPINIDDSGAIVGC